MNQIKVRIGEILLRKGMTKTELARRIGAPVSHVTVICNGHMRPSLRLATKIADELGKDAGELFREWNLFDSCRGKVAS